MTPEEFIKDGPKKPEDLIGKARKIAKVMCARAKGGNPRPIKLLFYGNPGIGKSAVCRLIANTLADHPSSIRHMSAVQVTVDNVRDWMTELRYHTDQWKVFWIEEVDSVNPAVELLLLQFIDLMSNKHALLVTSNEQMSGITPRFQSRCQAIRFEEPTVDEIVEMLVGRWPELGEAAREIAESNMGDVRASLNDAQGELDKRLYMEGE